MIRIEVNGIELAVEVSGPGDGRPVMLVHGWPDSGRLWRAQAAALAGAGFRVVVPDMRGYGGSDKPEEVEAYSIPFLASDLLGILDHLGIESTHLVGHDWGAAIAWATAALAPDRIDHLVALSVGHPSGFQSAGLPQREKSWYMLLFQFTGVAERWLSDNDWANFREWSQHPDADAVTAELEKNGSLTPGLNWYRANIPPESLVEGSLELPQVQAPTMGIWSSGDMALLETQMTASKDFVAGEFRYERIDGAGHWLQLEAADRVNELLLDFLPC